MQHWKKSVINISIHKYKHAILKLLWFAKAYMWLNSRLYCIQNCTEQSKQIVAKCKVLYHYMHNTWVPPPQPHPRNHNGLCSCTRSKLTFELHTWHSLMGTQGERCIHVHVTLSTPVWKGRHVFTFDNPAFYWIYNLINMWSFYQLWSCLVILFWVSISIQ